MWVICTHSLAVAVAKRYFEYSHLRTYSPCRYTYIHLVDWILCKCYAKFLCLFQTKVGASCSLIPRMVTSQDSLSVTSYLAV